MLVQKPVNFQNMVASDIYFVRDDFVERDRIKLSHVVNVVNSKPRQYEAKAVFLRNFVDCLVLASFKIKKSPDHTKMSEKDLIKRKEEILMRLTQLKKNEKKDKKDAILKLMRIKGIKEIICDGVKKTIATPENIEVISEKEKTQNFGLLALLLTIITLGFLLKGTLKSKKSY